MDNSLSAFRRTWQRISQFDQEGARSLCLYKEGVVYITRSKPMKYRSRLLNTKPKNFMPYVLKENGKLSGPHTRRVFTERWFQKSDHT